MGWIIIAIGAICSSFGGWVAYTGFEIVQVERGWSAVIAGTTLLSAGVVAIALGLMTLRITSLVKSFKSALTQPEAAKPLVKPAEIAPAGTNPVQTAVVDTKPSEHAPVHSATAISGAVVGATAVAAAVTAAVTEDSIFGKQGGTTKHDLDGKAPATEVESPAVEISLPKSSATKVASSLPEPPPVVSILDAVKVDEKVAAQPEHRQYDTPEWLKAKKPSQETDGLVAAQIAAEGAKHEAAARDFDDDETLAADPDDHLDAAGRYDSVEEDSAVVLPRQEHRPLEHAISEQLHLEHKELERPIQEQAPPVVPAVAPASHPVVVGQYEAAGTNYAMYSDGSVEAENEHGVFRFASMAELRTFIEEGQVLGAEQ